MDQNYFRGILKKYLQGQATAEEKKIIDAWYEGMEKSATPFSHPGEESETENRYWSAIHAHMGRTKAPARRRDLRPWYYSGIAASLLIALVAYLHVSVEEPRAEAPLAAAREDGTLQWNKIANTGTAPRLVTLPDNSQVTLHPHSRLKFSSDYGKTDRVVCLEGEAFFDVSRNEKAPFLVHVNGLTTEVLGTSFTVKAFREDRKVSVEVRTGKVSVYTREHRLKTKGNEIILTPNQKIVYDKKVNKLSRMIVDVPRVIVPPEEVRRMRFESAPVKEIFAAIEKVYGVDIVYDETRFATCTLTTAISDGDIFNRLDIICKVIGATYALEEDRIVISGDGCHSQ